MLRSASGRARVGRAPRASREEDEEPSSPVGLPGEDEDALNNEFIASFDQTKFLRELDAYTASYVQNAPKEVQPELVLPSLDTLAQLPTDAPTEIPVEFYGQVIQILTFVLGSNPPMLAESVQTPRHEAQWDPPDSNELTAADWATMHNVVTLIMEHFGSADRAPSTRVSEQELTRLLQKLMAKQQENAQRQIHALRALPTPPSFAYTPGYSGQAHFADLVFPDEEDDDDPDFQPLHAPSESAWTQAMRDLVATPLAVGDTPISPAKATRARKRAEAEERGAAPLPSGASPMPLHTPRPSGPGAMHGPSPSGVSSALPGPLAPLPGLDTSLSMSLGEPLAPLEPASPKPRKRGRRAIYTAEESAERRRERNRQHMYNRRHGVTAKPLPPALPPPPDQDTLVYEAENKFLRAEIERLRAENARLRGREEMRQYAARMGLPDLPPVEEEGW